MKAGELHISEYQGEEERQLLSRAEQVFERGDFYLSNAEQRMVDVVKQNFKKVIVVMNVGGMVDTSWFCAIRIFRRCSWHGRAVWKAVLRRQIFCAGMHARPESWSTALRDVWRIIRPQRASMIQNIM